MADGSATFSDPFLPCLTRRLCRLIRSEKRIGILMVMTTIIGWLRSLAGLGGETRWNHRLICQAGS